MEAMERIRVFPLETILDLIAGNRNLLPVINGGYERWRMISISQGQGPFEIDMHMLSSMGCLSVLPLGFSDIDFDSLKNECKPYKKEAAFNKYHAKNIIEFLDNHRPGQALAIHCEAGISRSAAVGEFAKEYLGEDGCYFHRKIVYPNQHVLRLLRKEAGFARE